MTTRRPHMPLGVKLAACLWLLGFREGDDIDWDHDPALGLRRRLEDGSFDPPANEARYIVPRLRAAHAVKTNGTPATTAGSDKARIAKVRRIEADQVAFRARLLAKDQGSKPVRWQSRRMPSRPFGIRKAKRDRS